MEKAMKLKYLSSYLPYKVLVGDGRTPFELAEHNFTNVFKYITEIYLRPLSDLTKEVEVNGERFVPIEKLRKDYSGFWFEYSSKLLIKSKNTNLYISTDWTNEISNRLFEWKFDVFDLQSIGLAIDINTLEQ